MARADVLHGPVGRTIVALAGPVIAAEAIHTGFHLIDVAWVGPLGPRVFSGVTPLGAWATGAIMTSMFTLWMAFSLSNLVTTGLGAQVSRAIGSGNRDHAGHAVAQALYLCLALGALVAVAGYALAGRLFALVGTDARVSEAGTAYLETIALGTPFAFLYLMAGSVMRSCGNTKTPMKITGAALLCNVVLAPLLIYGIGPFPKQGVRGSAIATVLCMAGAVLAYAVMALSRHPDLPLLPASLGRVDLRMIGALARVGTPYAAIGVLFSIVYLYYAHLASAFGEAAVAVLGIGNRLESITYLSGDGFAVATATFVGQNLGARDGSRAARGAWRAAAIMTGFGAVITVVFAAIPETLLGFFTSDAEALRIGVPYMRVLALCQLFTALEGVIGGGFAGAGDTVPPMGVHTAFSIARVPLAGWAVWTLGLGLQGIAWTMSLTCIVRAVMLALWFRRGRWKERVLPGAKVLPAPDAVDIVEA